MSRASLDTSRLPQDVLTYTNNRFFDFIQNFCGKDEADLLAVQSIRSVDSFLSIKDMYTIFTLDSEDLDAIQKRCGFRNRNGHCTVRPGIRSSLDHVHNLLTKKQKEAAKVKKSPPMQSSVADASPSSNDDDSIVIQASKTEADHREKINSCIEEWCLQNKNNFSVDGFDFALDLTYGLHLNASLDKADIKCSCGLSLSLSLGEAGNFKISNYFRHLKYTCPITQIKSMNVSNDGNGTPLLPDISQTSSASAAEQTSTNPTRKRAPRAGAISQTAKKIRGS